MIFMAPAPTPDFRCYGQGDGTFLCHKLTWTSSDVVWICVVSVILLLVLTSVVIDIRNARRR